MNERALIYFLVFIIWSQVSWRWYTTEIRGFYRFESSATIDSQETSDKDSGSLEAVPRTSPFELKEDGAILFFPYKSVSQTLDNELSAHLKNLAQKVMESDRHIKVIGHTDSKGSDAYNKRLGKERAEKVADILEGYGVEIDRLNVISRGEEDLLYANEQEGPAAMNRRVEIIFTGPANECQN